MKGKRFLSAALALVLVCALLPAAAQGADSDFIIDSSGVLTRYVGSGGDVVIPDNVTAIRDYVFSGNTGITGVTIPASVTSIGEYAFESCAALTEVNILGGVTSIGKEAFEGCTKLERAAIAGGGAAVIGLNAFCNCTALADLTLGDGVGTVGYRAFGGCTSLTEVSLSADVTHLDHYAFANCTSLTTVTGGAGLTWIGIDTFDNTPFLNEQEGDFPTLAGFLLVYRGSESDVTIPDAVTGIADLAFSDYRDLTRITLGKNLRFLGERPFYGCYDLTELAVDPANGWFAAEDGVLFNGAKTALLACPAAKSGKYIVPYPVKTIGDYAFAGCSSLTGVFFCEPGNVTTIQRNAFWGCALLESVTLPAGVTRIEEETFRDCWNLTRVFIPDTVTSIGQRAFEDCWSLSSIDIPDSVTVIENNAFRSCARTNGKTGLSQVNIGNGVETIGNYAFDGCTCLTDLTLGDHVQVIGYSAFNGCSRLTEVTIPASVTVLSEPYYTFSGCDSLERITVEEANRYYASVDGILMDKDKTAFLYFPGALGGTVTVPDTVTDIGQAFMNHPKITGVTLGSGVTDVGSQAFYMCTNLREVTIGPNVTNIASDAFTNCTRLERIVVDPANLYYTSVDGVLFTKNKTILCTCPGGRTGDYAIPQGVTWIYDHAFSGCRALTGVTIPNSVTRIGYLGPTFEDCRSLTSVTIPDSVTYISEGAFMGCYDLAEVRLPAGITAIPDMMFSATALKQFNVPDGVTSIGAYSFSSSHLKRIMLPASVTRIERGAFNSCSALTDVYYAGSEEQWSQITVGDINVDLADATIHFNADLAQVERTLPLTYYQAALSGGEAIIAARYDESGKMTAVTMGVAEKDETGCWAVMGKPVTGEGWTLFFLNRDGYVPCRDKALYRE